MAEIILFTEPNLKITKENNLLCLEDNSVKECFDVKKILETLITLGLTEDKASKEAISIFLSAKTISLSGNIEIQKP